MVRAERFEFPEFRFGIRHVTVEPYPFERQERDILPAALPDSLSPNNASPSRTLAQAYQKFLKGHISHTHLGHGHIIANTTTSLKRL